MRVSINKITGCVTKRSDKNNGFFIVQAHGHEEKNLWGTCFFRVMRKQHDEIWVKFNRHPKCMHTYTKFPARVANLVFHVYANYDPKFSILLELAPGSRIIGFDQPQRSGNYLNRSFLVLSPSGIEPNVLEYMPEYGEEEDMNLFFYEHGEDGPVYPCSEQTYFDGKEVQHMYLDAKGYQTIPQAAGGDKFDHQPPPDRYQHYEGGGSQPLEDFIPKGKQHSR